MESLLTLFETLTEQLKHLTELAKRKTTAVRKSDLMELDKILKEEQAQSLVLRGLDQKRTALLQQLGLQNVPLTGLPARVPAELQQRTATAVENLRREFSIYRSAAEVARNTLECNLHEIEKFLAAAGAADDAGAGYSSGNVEPPAKMKSDFRA